MFTMYTYKQNRLYIYTADYSTIVIYKILRAVFLEHRVFHTLWVLQMNNLVNKSNYITKFCVECY